MMKRTGSLSILGLALVLAPVAAVGQGTTPANWVGSWAASQQLPEPQNSLSAEDLRDATLRQIVHLSVGGPELRVHVSNAFGTAPLHLTAVHVARPAAGGGAIDPASDKALTFGGAPDVTVPAGAEYISDPVAFSVGPLSDLVITLHMDAAPASQTGHPGSRATSYVAHGDLVSAVSLPDAKKVEHWYQVSGVDVAVPGTAVVTLGDSITDGRGSTTNGNDRWPDVLARRLQADKKTQTIGVLNAGTGGNRVLLDGLGPNALARFDRDVLAPAGVRYVIVLEGINDLGTFTHEANVGQAEHDALVHRILSAYEQMALRAHAHGIKVIGATILPYGESGYYRASPVGDADRQAINQWIRTTKNFDAVVDFDKVVRDPAHPEQMLPAYDSGDHLHPSAAGYKVMGEAIPLSLFAH